MQDLIQSFFIEAPIDDVFEAMTNAHLIDDWSGIPGTVMEPVKGGKFSYFEGGIHGTNLEIIPGKKLVQEWYAGEWEKPSSVSIELTSAPEGTMIELIQKNIPEDDFEEIEYGWEHYFFGAIQEMFEEE